MLLLTWRCLSPIANNQHLSLFPINPLHPLHGKDDAVERGNFRGLKLLDHLMKVFERVIEKYIREAVNIDDMQFGFMPGKGTMDAIFITRIMQERFLAKKKNLYFTC